jgi:LysM repeat protein
VERSRVTRWAAPVAFLLAVTILALVLRAGFEHGKHHRDTPVTTVSQQRKKKTHAHGHPKQHVQTYTVESGDTFESIATKTGTTVAKLTQLNPSVDPTALQVGEKIRVK